MLRELIYLESATATTLERPKPNMAVVQRGFAQGRNSPEDVESMARLFRQFRHVSYMARAIAIWTEGDQ